MLNKNVQISAGRVGTLIFLSKKVIVSTSTAVGNELTRIGQGFNIQLLVLLRSTKHRAMSTRLHAKLENETRKKQNSRKYKIGYLKDRIPN